jgi:hypothetical protein
VSLNLFSSPPMSKMRLGSKWGTQGVDRGKIGLASRPQLGAIDLDEDVSMKKMTCYGCKGKGHTSGEVCEICGGSGNIPVPAEPVPPPAPEMEEKPGKE